MTDRPFVHLHCHTHYSVLDGAAQPKNLVEQAKKLGMNALAITDHGNLFGAIEFYEACKTEGLNPVLGYEAYVSPAHRTDRQARGGTGGEASFHLTMLAQNRTGFHNLIKLASHAYLEGFYYKPRIDKELLEAHSEGLVILSGCASSEFSSLLLGERLDEAVELAEWFARTFKDRFFLEIQDNGLDFQKICAQGCFEVAKRVGLPLVATCDTHYLCADDAHAHEVLLCINTGKTMSDPKRLRYGSNEFFLKSPAEMYACFPDHADAVKRSQEIANSIDINLDFSTRHFPVFAPPAGKDDKSFLRELCEEGLQRRFGDAISEDALKRLDWELGVINKLGFASYFLIVWDFVNYANEKGIPCGARGSACGALVSYLLGFSNVDPIKYDLLFERFLDPSRAEAPDIDVDFCQHRREEVIEYVRQKYGEKNVAQIITFGTMAARAVVRDVGRAMEVPLARVDKIAKMIPQVLKITLTEALEQSAELRKEYDSDPDIRKVIDVGKRLEGLARNAGTHAAGVVISDRDITDYVPLQKNGDIVTTQWEMAILEKVGMLKVDFLGLRNLTLLTNAVKVIAASRNTPPLDLLKIPLDDPATFALLQRGETKGVFQLESEGIRNLLMRLRPDSFFDIIAVNALYRPGPLGGGMVDKYINVKHGREFAEYVHPVMCDVLEETYGVMVYQEQVMRILNRLGGIELADSYKCIKAISKKKHETIAKYREQFVATAKQKGLEENKSSVIFGLIEHFAGYGFNKSHSTAYALVAYQTAYLKAHFPAEFMAALMSSEVDKTELLVEHIDDCRRMGIEVKPPDVNESEAHFSVLGTVIRFGLSAIKGVGEKAIDSIATERKKNGPYKSLFDFCERTDIRIVPKACIEALIKCGAMDSLGPKRAQLLAGLPLALQAGAQVRDARDSGQGMLFGGDEDADTSPTQALPDVSEWADQEKLAYEKALLGIYLSSHPLTEKERQLRLFRTHQVNEVRELQPRQDIVLGGMLTAVRQQTQQKGRNANQRYARFNFEDLTGSIGCVMFAEAFAQFGPKVVNDAVVFCRAEVDTSREEVGLIVNEVIEMESAPRCLSGSFIVRLDAELHTVETLAGLARVLKGRPGSSPVLIELTAPEPEPIRIRMRADAGMGVICDEELAQQVEAILGPGRVSIAPPIRDGRSQGGGNGYSNGSGNGQRRFTKSRT